MNARKTILDQLRGQAGRDTAIPAAFSLARDSDRSVSARFGEAAEQNGIQVCRINDPRQIPDRLRKLCPDCLDNRKIAVAPGLSHLPWTSGADIVFGSNDGSAPTGISLARGAVARSGALVLINHPDTPASINFLSKDHIILVNESCIRETLAEVLADGFSSNGLNLISGPSSTADIGGKLLVGVHGPARVYCCIITEELTEKGCAPDRQKKQKR